MRNNFLVISLLQCVLGFSHAQTISPRQLLEESERYPVITVPLITKAPVINGTLNEDEWAGASVIRDLIYDATNTTQRSGLGARHRSSIRDGQLPIG